jgi:hypothetical protein
MLAKTRTTCCSLRAMPPDGTDGLRRIGMVPLNYGLEIRRVSDIEARPVNWLWPGRIARGKVTMLAGHPGLGKSQAALAIAAIVTIGGRWPVDRVPAERGSVIIMSAEGGPEDTIRPRLEAAGADLACCHVTVRYAIGTKRARTASVGSR